MRNMLIGALIILSSTVSGWADAWQTVSSPEGRFSAQMPGKPQVTSAKHGTPVGSITEHSYVSGNCVVEYQDLPGIAMMFKGKGGIIKRAKSEFLKHQNATLVSETKIDIDGHSADRITYSSPAGKGEAVFVMDGHRLYVITSSGADANRFLSSIRIGNIATGP